MHIQNMHVMFLENQRKQALLEEGERKKKEQAKEVKRAEQKTKTHVHEQLAEQELEQLEAIHVALWLSMKQSES